MRAFFGSQSLAALLSIALPTCIRDGPVPSGDKLQKKLVDTPEATSLQYAKPMGGLSSNWAEYGLF